MYITELIELKKNAKTLTDEQIKFFVNGYTNGEIKDYQASALAMAICINGMNEEETTSLTLHMAKSGDFLDLSTLGDITVDKHSTGGVGDKVTLIAAPIAAAAGVTVAKMSGKGLGFTGGTIDKLEAIPNLKTEMPVNSFIKQAKDIGMVVAGASGNMVPCDKKLYALRDVTATVDSLPLIASSIMSKKLAAGSKSIVLDVKYGNGAFMQTKEAALELANMMIKIGKNCNKRITVLLTNMNSPLGFAIGNTLEINEVISLLKGEDIRDLKELSLAVASEMIALGKQIEPEDAKKEALNALISGKAYEKFEQMIKYQGGSLDNLKSIHTEYEHKITAVQSGYISAIDALSIGNACVALGAGRRIKLDKIDPNAGIVLSKKEGDTVEIGDTLLTMYTNKKDAVTQAETLLQNTFSISSLPNKQSPVVDLIIR